MTAAGPPPGWPRDAWPPTPIVLATANAGKTNELAALLEGVAQVIARPQQIDDVEETADTLLGNARLKAQAIANATHCVALADDTGLEVDALGGRPGVYSARYAGIDGDSQRNMELLLAELAELAELAVHEAAAPAREPGRASARPPRWRSARFRTVLVLQHPNGAELVTTGEVAGRIAYAPAGTAGFGYDPIFVPDEGDGRTFGEMRVEEKQEISHRGRALRSLLASFA